MALAAARRERGTARLRQRLTDASSDLSESAVATVLPFSPRTALRVAVSAASTSTGMFLHFWPRKRAASWVRFAPTRCVTTMAAVQ